MNDRAVRWSFLVEAHDEADALLRVLSPFAVQGARLAEVILTRTGGALAIRLQVENLEAARAESLLRRLAALPVVLSAGLGWRQRAPPADPGAG
jgi:hypothetical protein